MQRDAVAYVWPSDDGGYQAPQAKVRGQCEDDVVEPVRGPKYAHKRSYPKRDRKRPPDSKINGRICCNMLAMLERTKTATTEMFCEHLDVGMSTVYNHVAFLVRQGRLQRHMVWRPKRHAIYRLK